MKYKIARLSGDNESHRLKNWSGWRLFKVLKTTLLRSAHQIWSTKRLSASETAKHHIFALKNTYKC